MIRSKKIIESYVCPYCWHKVYECTCYVYPPYSLIMIDENIQEIIRILNNKGYATLACCESHYLESYSIYILFSQPYNFKCPSGFKLSRNGSMISHVFTKAENKTIETYEKAKAENLNTLLEWSESLPTIN